MKTRTGEIPHPPPYRILLIDDEPNIVKAFETVLLERFGQDFFHFTRLFNTIGVEVSAVAGKFDLVLSGVVQPGEDGIEFMQRMRCGGVATRWVFMSGWDKAKALVEKTGCFEFLPLPLEAEDLVGAVARALNIETPLPHKPVR